MKKTIAIIVGSLREKSYNLAVAKHVVSLLPEGVTAKFIDIGSLPFYNEDLEAKPPEAWVKMRGQVKSVDAVLFFTPEYNRTIPAALKNALDVGSRPYGEGVWSGKPGGVISVSQGAIGGFGANHHLRQALTFLNVYTMQQPEAYIGGIASAVNEEGQVINEGTTYFLQSYLDAFLAWMDKF